MTKEFNVKSIVGIKTVEESPNYSYIWGERKPESSKFFGLIKVPGVSEGFRELGTVGQNILSHEEIEKRGYNVREDKVFYRPYAIVYLEHEYQVQKVFKTHQEMLNWVNHLKQAHGGNFEIVNY